MRVTFEAVEPARLAGYDFEPGEVIEVTFPDGVDLEDGMGEGGPWGWGGFTSGWILAHALQVREAGKGVLIYERDAPDG